MAGHATSPAARTSPAKRYRTPLNSSTPALTNSSSSSALRFFTSSDTIENSSVTTQSPDFNGSKEVDEIPSGNSPTSSSSASTRRLSGSSETTEKSSATTESSESGLNLGAVEMEGEAVVEQPVALRRNHSSSSLSSLSSLTELSSSYDSNSELSSPPRVPRRTPGTSSRTPASRRRSNSNTTTSSRRKKSSNDCATAKLPATVFRGPDGALVTSTGYAPNKSEHKEWILENCTGSDLAWKELAVKFREKFGGGMRAGPLRHRYGYWKKKMQKEMEQLDGDGDDEKEEGQDDNGGDEAKDSEEQTEGNDTQEAPEDQAEDQDETEEPPEEANQSQDTAAENDEGDQDERMEDAPPPVANRRNRRRRKRGSRNNRRRNPSRNPPSAPSANPPPPPPQHHASPAQIHTPAPQPSNQLETPPGEPPPSPPQQQTSATPGVSRAGPTMSPAAMQQIAEHRANIAELEEEEEQILRLMEQRLQERANLLKWLEKNKK